MSRDAGEVCTDVFIDAHDMFEYHGLSAPLSEKEGGTAIIVECKYSGKDTAGSVGRYCELLGDMAREPGASARNAIPVLITKDDWVWVRLEDFVLFFNYFAHRVQPDFTKLRIDTENRKMSKFFYNALAQAKAAVIPRRDNEKPYHQKLLVICVGTNAHKPKVVGFAPDCLVDLKGEA